MKKVGNNLNNISFNSLSRWKKFWIVFNVAISLLGFIALLCLCVKKIFDGYILSGIIFFVLSIFVLVVTIYLIKCRNWNALLTG